MRTLAIIPARYASSRFPGKPLVDIRGKSMIRRVYERVQAAAGLAGVVVATDDARIYDHVAAFGGAVQMTRADHGSGTERLAEVAAQEPGFTHFINVQGDEPFIDPAQVAAVAGLLGEPDTAIATLVAPLTEAAQLHDPAVVKVALGATGQALYFSRAPIPWCRDGADAADWLRRHRYFRHIGIYGFAREVLLRIPELPPVAAEVAESLEQLRWLAHGYAIRVGHTDHAARGIDRPEDLEALLRNWPGEEV